MQVAQLYKDNAVLGIISDTHGLLRPEILKIFSGVDYIIHAGDIGNNSILQNLEKIAPVIAVTGNTDSPIMFINLEDTAVLELNQISIYIIHNVSLLDLDPHVAGMSAVIYGHSHNASINRKNEVLYFNPGSAGPRRFDIPVSAGILRVNGKELKAEIVTIHV